eukprot:12987365-Alexandrium_andersonii.AAC.1
MLGACGYNRKRLAIAVGEPLRSGSERKRRGFALPAPRPRHVAVVASERAPEGRRPLRVPEGRSSICPQGSRGGSVLPTPRAHCLDSAAPVIVGGRLS